MALSLIKDQTSTPLGGNETYTGDSVEVGLNKDYLVGSCYADQDGIVKIQFSKDGTNWDVEETRDYTATEKLGFRIHLMDEYARVVFENGSSDQNTFRLHWRAEEFGGGG